MGIEDRDWYRNRQAKVMEDHYYNPRQFRANGDTEGQRLSWLSSTWWYVRSVVEALIAPADGAALVLAGPCVVGWLMFRSDPRIAAWQFAQLLVSLDEGRWLIFAGANLAIAGVIVTVMKRWMRPITARGGVMPALAWIALPVCVILYGVFVPLFATHGFSIGTATAAPTMLVTRVASTHYPVAILLGLVVYGVWGLAVWLERIHAALKRSR